MPKSWAEQRNEILRDAGLSLEERHVRMLEVSERRAASREKTPAQLLAECETSAEVAEVCRAFWSAQGDAVIEADGRARWKTDPTPDPHQRTSQPAPPDDGMIRKVLVAPNGRRVVIEAMSTFGLDVYERAIMEGKL